jgi:hypothetical protein
VYQSLVDSRRVVWRVLSNSPTACPVCGSDRTESAGSSRLTWPLPIFTLDPVSKLLLGDIPSLAAYLGFNPDYNVEEAFKDCPPRNPRYPGACTGRVYDEYAADQDAYDEYNRNR